MGIMGSVSCAESCTASRQPACEVCVCVFTWCRMLCVDAYVLTWRVHVCHLCVDGWG